jgi:molybdate transport system regulatory protein
MLYPEAMAQLSIRVDVPDKVRIGPGKIQLLEAVGEQGSISGAGRFLGMSYKRAWDLIAEMNSAFEDLVVLTQPGGRTGGGAVLTPLGKELVAHYRAIVVGAEKAAAKHLEAIEAATKRSARK